MGRQRKGGPTTTTGVPFTKPVSNGVHSNGADVLHLRRQASQNYRELVQQAGKAFRISPDFTEEPHQVLIGGFLMLFFCTSAVASTVGRIGPDVSSHSALVVLLIMLLIHSMFNARDSLTVRPHPAVWRALHGINLWYFVCLGVLAAVHVEHGVELMELVFSTPKLENDKPIEKIGLDHLSCEINWPTVERQLYSLWFKAHVIGWWAKMIILRDFRMCLVYSAAFELMELTLQFLVAELQECWWDSIVLDFVFANMTGMMLGYLTLRLWWILESSGRMFAGHNIERGISVMFTPYSWPKYEWNPIEDPFKMVLNSVVWVSMLVGELNSFFLMNMFQIVRAHPFNILRQVILCLIAVPAVAEWYAYRKDKAQRIGHFFWLLFMSVSLETVIIVKYSDTYLHLRAPPVGTWLPWVLCLLMFSGYFYSYCKYFYDVHRSSEIPKYILCLKYFSFVPLISLGQNWAF